MNLSIALPILAGLFVGWIINYLSDVLPVTRRFSAPGCRNCEMQIGWADYLTLRACRACGKHRSVRSWLTHAFSMTVSLWFWSDPHPKLGFALGLLLLTYLSVVFVIDLEHRLILHPVSLAGAVLGLGTGWLLHGLGSTLWGGLAGLLIMLVFYVLGMQFTRIRARRMQATGQEPDDEEALGAGDVFLAGVLGLILGWPLIWFSLLLGALLGGVVALLMIAGMLVIRQYKKDAWMVFIPYGPFLLFSAAAIIYLPKLISVLVPR